MTPQWFKNRFSRDDDPIRGLPLIVVLDGFLNAGNIATLAHSVLSQNFESDLHEFDADSLLDHRARRPMIRFSRDHYHDYRPHRLVVSRHRDVTGSGYLLLSGFEPDFGWEQFADEIHDLVDEHHIPLVLSLGGVPMGVPHTRPTLLTSHGTRPELIDRHNMWDTEIQIPASAQSMLEYRLGEAGHDAAGYVAHIPHYLGQVDYPTAAIELLKAAGHRLNLTFDLDKLVIHESDTNAQIESQIEEQGGLDILSGLEDQYDAFHRGLAQSLLADAEELPTGEELAHEFEEFLARHSGEGQN